MMSIEERAKELVAAIWRPSSNEVRCYKAKIILQAERDDMREQAAKLCSVWASELVKFGTGSKRTEATHLGQIAQEIRDLK